MGERGAIERLSGTPQSSLTATRGKRRGRTTESKIISLSLKDELDDGELSSLSWQAELQFIHGGIGPWSSS